jgi:hypothetical protein
VLGFGGRAIIQNPDRLEEIKKFYPSATILLCSTAGEILDTQVLDNSISVTAIQFNKTHLEFFSTKIDQASESEAKGAELAKKLPIDNLAHVMVFSDGLKVNGTALVNGLSSALPKKIAITGGLVGDGPDFKQTVIGLNNPPSEGMIVVIGFYSTELHIGYGSLGGWDTFGPERIITKSKDNILYELDDKPALKLYKEYLGDQAQELPASGLLFPLSIQTKDSNGEDKEIVRTLLGINEADQSMIFAGDIPQGKTAKLMMANFERLIDGAAQAANMSLNKEKGQEAELAILISCIGRKLVLKERTEEELDAVRSTLGNTPAITGYYSYGEICPTSPTENQCHLHNQTMTITTFKET